MIMRVLVIVPLMIFLVAGVLGYFYVIAPIRVVDKGILAARARHMEALEKDASEVEAAIRAFPAATATPANLRDAGPYLNARLPLHFEEHPSGKTPEGAAWVKENAHQVVELKDTAEGKESSYFDLNFFKSLAVHPKDFMWLRELHKFDYWEVQKNSPVEKWPIHEYAVAGFVTNLIAPIETLKQAITEDFVSGLRAGDLNPAAQDAVKLVQLLESSEGLILTLCAEGISYRFQELLNGLKEVQKAGAFKNVKMPKSVPKSDAVRALPSMRTIIHPWTPADRIEKIFLTEPIHKELCSIVKESLQNVVVYRPLLKDNISQFFAQTDAIYKRYATVCRFEKLRSYWSDPSFEVLDLSTLSPKDLNSGFLKLPKFFNGMIRDRLGWSLVAVYR